MTTANHVNLEQVCSLNIEQSRLLQNVLLLKTIISTKMMNLIGCHFVLQYLNGHSDVIMGALLMDSERLHSKLAAVQVLL